MVELRLAINQPSNDEGVPHAHFRGIDCKRLQESGGGAAICNASYSLPGKHRDGVAHLGEYSQKINVDGGALSRSDVEDLRRIFSLSPRFCISHLSISSSPVVVRLACLHVLSRRTAKKRSHLDEHDQLRDFNCQRKRIGHGGSLRKPCRSYAASRVQ